MYHFFSLLGCTMWFNAKQSELFDIYVTYHFVVTWRQIIFNTKYVCRHILSFLEPEFNEEDLFV